MRAKEFVAEVLDTDLSVEELARLIKRDCAEYLANSTPRNFLYRGLSRRNKGILHDVPLRVRTKPYTSLEATEALSDLMAADGFKATRMSTFATLDVGEAEGFGDAYCVFPIGDYSLTYHKPRELRNRYEKLTRDDPIMSIYDFNDLGANTWQKIAITTGKEYDEYYGNPKYVKEVAKLFWEKYKDCFYQTKNPDDIASSEVMIAGTKAHLLDPEAFPTNEWKQFISLIYGE